MKLKLVFLILSSVTVDTVLSAESRCEFTRWGKSGVIDSHSPGESRSHTCSWIIETPVQRKIELDFHDLKIDNPDCSNGTNVSYLRIANMVPQTVVMFKYFCNQKTPFKLEFNATSLNITFRVSDNTNSKSHFRLAYRVIDQSECVQEFRQESGVIMSPNYPAEIPTAITNTYKIIAPEGFVIRLRLTHLDIQTNGSVCINYLSVRDGVDDSPMVANHCGRRYYLRGLVYQSSKNEMSLKFVTFHALERLQGFYAVYDMVTEEVGRTSYRNSSNCSVISASPSLHPETDQNVSEFHNSRCVINLYAPSGVLLPSDFPDEMISRRCIYKIIQPPGATIRLSFTQVNGEYSMDYTWFKFFQIRNGSGEKSPLIESFYDVHHFIMDEPIESRNSMFIQVEDTIHVTHWYGYHAVYDTVYDDTKFDHSNGSCIRTLNTSS